MKLNFVLIGLFIVALSPGLVEQGPGGLLPSAWADDDDGGDDDGGGGGSAAGSSYGSGNTYKQKQKRASKKYVRQKSRLTGNKNRKPSRVKSSARLPTRASREIVILGYTQNAKQTLIARGYEFLDERTLNVQLRNNIAKLRIPRNLSLEDARRDLRLIDATSPVDFNHYYRPVQDANCNDPQCAVLQSVGWTPDSGTKCDLSPTIGFVETAVDLKHSLFRQKPIEVISLRTAGRKNSGSNHGTAVVSLLYSDKNTKTPGILPNAKVVVADPYHIASSGDERTDVYDLVRAIDFLISQKLDVINLSLAGPDNELLRTVIGDAYDKGLPVVAAVGNSSSRSEIFYPAGYGTVIAVTAVDAKGKVFKRANRGQHIDFSAPGVGVWGAASSSSYKQFSGTSFAAPFVSAAVGMMRARDSNTEQEVLVAKLKSLSRDLGKVGPDETFGNGLVQFTDLCK